MSNVIIMNLYLTFNWIFANLVKLVVVLMELCMAFTYYIIGVNIKHLYLSLKYGMGIKMKRRSSSFIGENNIGYQLVSSCNMRIISSTSMVVVAYGFMRMDTFVLLSYKGRKNDTKTWILFIFTLHTLD
eukprot:UN07915